MTATNLPQPGAKSRIWRLGNARDRIARDRIARVLILAVLLSNLSAAIPFILQPETYAGSFELGGVAGAIITRSFGILFLMWVTPYAPALWHPRRYRICLNVALAQQCIGLVGELWMWLALPAGGHAALHATGLRFIVFDTAGLVLLAAAWLLTRRA